MSTLRKACLYSSLALGAAAVAGAVWYLYRKRRPRQQTPRPAPAMVEWEYWKLCRRIGTLPPSINSPQTIHGACSVGENILDPLYPDTSVFFFVTESPSPHPEDSGEGDSPWTVKMTLWRHSFLRDEATPFCSFKVRDSIHGYNVDFNIIGQYLLFGLAQRTSVWVLVFNHHGKFLRQIQLEDAPLIVGGMAYFSFDDNHCHLLIVTPAASHIQSFKFHIDPVNNSANCVQRNTIRMPPGKEFRLCWLFPDCIGFQMVAAGEMRDISDLWIHYDHTSAALTPCLPEELFNGRLVNWKHQLNVIISLFNFEDQKLIDAYKGCHGTSTVSGSTTLRELYLVCRKEEGGTSAEEEEQQTSINLSIYSFRLEPKSLKGLTLSAVLKNFPQAKDLPEKEMIALGIPPNVAAAFEEHKSWECDPCIDLGVL